MKRGTITLITALVICGTGSILSSTPERHVLDIPVILQDGKFQGREIKLLCGTTCAEMIIRYYGITGITRVDIAEKFCSEMYPRYNKKMDYTNTDKKKYSTWCESSLSGGGRFSGTNTHVLELFFRELGFSTDRKRTNFDRSTGMVPLSRFNAMMKHVKMKRPVIIHVEYHYMLVVGCDDVRKKLIINDPSDPERLEVGYASFKNNNSRWRRTRPERKGWDGRYLAVWK